MKELNRKDYIKGIKPMISGIKKAAAKYYDVTQRPLGVTGEIAEYEAITRLKLHPVPPREKGRDAYRLIGKKKKYVQIKGRVTQPDSKSGQRVGTLKPENNNWSTAVLVLMNEKYEPYEILEVSRKALKAYMKKAKGKAVKERGQISVERFRSLTEKVWLKKER